MHCFLHCFYALFWGTDPFLGNPSCQSLFLEMLPILDICVRHFNCLSAALFDFDAKVLGKGVCSYFKIHIELHICVS